MKKQNKKMLTATSEDDIFLGFKNDKERIKIVSAQYRNMGIAKAFAHYYNTEVSTDLKTNKIINTVTVIELGKCYSGSVKEIMENGTIVFDMPGVKEEIISKENFNGCRDAIENYLLNHDNKLLFEVREAKPGKFIVSVINAYYNDWQNQINKIIQTEDGINCHIDSLTKGGYLCHTVIWPLKELTGKDYTSSVFIPGSHIVLNIERDFEKWIGQDVIIVPQKFVEFRKDMKTGLVENSLVGSRKKVLQRMGVANIYQIYSDMETAKKLSALSTNGTATDVESESFEGTVTGIICSSKKQGAFVELNDKYITGLLPLEGYEITNYHPGDTVTVRIKEWETQEGKDPFVLNRKGSVVRANVRPVFKLA